MSVVAAALCGFVLDLLLADPPAFPHPVVWMGPGYRGAGALSASALSADTVRPARRWRSAGGYAAGGYAGAERSGVSCDLAHPSGAGVCRAGAMELAGAGGAWSGAESRRVYEQLRRGDLAAARRAVGRIVGRDTERLDEAGVTRAAVETVAENFSDGVVAPLMYLLLGGAPVGAVL